jgi:hypothetical protein
LRQRAERSAQRQPQHHRRLQRGPPVETEIFEHASSFRICDIERLERAFEIFHVNVQ